MLDHYFLDIQATLPSHPAHINATSYQWKTVSIQGQNHFGLFMRITPDGNSFSGELPDHQTDGVYFTDTERRITHWNKGAEALCGFSLPEVVGKRCNDHLLMHIDASGHEHCMHDCPLEATLQESHHHDRIVKQTNAAAVALPDCRAAPLFKKDNP